MIYISDTPLVGGSQIAKQRYAGLISALGGVYFDGYKTIQENICFEKAVFGYDKSLLKMGELEELIRRRMNVSSTYCTTKKTRILILNRASRRILNTEQLANELQSRLNATVEIVQFENMQLAEQIQRVHCADLLIGVQGAGLNHFRFLPKGGAVLEIGWEHWPVGLYCYLATTMGFKCNVIDNCSAKISEHAWRAFYNTNKDNDFKYMTHDEVLNLANHVEFQVDENIWKFADCEINISDAVQKAHHLLNV